MQYSIRNKQTHGQKRLMKRNAVYSACVVACAMVIGTVSQQARAIDITYDDSGSVTLQIAPHWQTSGAATYLYPGTSANPSTSGNTITVNYLTNTNPSYVYGGFAGGSNAITSNDNTVYFINGDVAAIWGGSADALNSSASSSLDVSANNNTVIVSGGQVGNAYGVMGGGTDFIYQGNQDVTANVSGNSVYVSAGTIGPVIGSRIINSVYVPASGLLTINLNNNTVDISGGTVTAFVTGVWASDLSYKNEILNANYNTVNIHAGTIQDYVAGVDIYSWYEGNAAMNLNYNTVSINGGTIGSNVFGALAVIEDKYTATLDVSHNTVNVSAGIIDGYIAGADVFSWSNNYGDDIINVSYNTVNISGGTIGSSVYGAIGEVEDKNTATVNVTHNTVNISGSPTFAATSSIYGGRIWTWGSGNYTTDAFTGNTLNFSAQPIAISNMWGFEYYNFVLPASAVDGTVLITASGTVDVDNAKVEVKGIAAGSPLLAGNKVILIDAVTLTGTSVPVNSSVTQGISLIYDIAVEQSGNQIIATIVDFQNTDGSGNGGDGSIIEGTSYMGLPARVNPQTKALSEGRLAGLAFIRQGADLVAEQGINSALASTQHLEGQLVAFGTAAGSTSRYKSGSHVNVDGFSMLAGAAYRKDAWLVGGFIEGGWGNYDSHNSFNNALSVHGDGDTKYYGAGLLGRYDFETGAYLDASFRAGKTDTDFKSYNLISAEGLIANYDSKSTYYSAHIGAGYMWKIAEDTRVDTSLKYLWTRQGSDSVTVVGDPIHFENANSHRLRANARVLHDLTPQVALVGGLGYEYEFNGDVDATTYYVYKIDSPSLKGGTGIVELGLSFTPSSNTNLTLDAKLLGYVGKREGVTGVIQLRYAF